MSQFKLDPSYKQVPERIADFKAKHPEGCLRPADPSQPYRIETIDGQTFIIYTAAAFRTPDDPCPGIGIAWEPFPGKTPYTADSELQNAETSAWGRAIVAVLASESKSIASAEDVRNRRADQEAPQRPSKPRKGEPAPFVSAENAQALRDKCESLGVDVFEAVKLGTSGRTEQPEEVRIDEISAVKKAVDGLTPADAA